MVQKIKLETNPNFKRMEIKPQGVTQKEEEW